MTDDKYYPALLYSVIGEAFVKQIPVGQVLSESYSGLDPDISFLIHGYAQGLEREWDMIEYVNPIQAGAWDE